MVHTDFYIAAAADSAVFCEHRDKIRYIGEKETIDGITRSETKSTLLLAFAGPDDDGKNLSRKLFMCFSERFERPKAAYTHFDVSFIDESAGDMVQYQCDRPSDIETVMDEEGGRYRCCSLTICVVQPTASSFDLLNTRLTMMLLRENDGDLDLAKTADAVSSAMGISITSICVYVTTTDPSFARHSFEMASSLRKQCAVRVFGVESEITQSNLLHDVRSWSLLVNEFHHMAPVSAGPYLINLNPHLVVGEKLAHSISPGLGYIVAEGDNAGHADVIVLPENNQKDPGGRLNVFTPHCRITYEDGVVCLRPECGMTYINGKLLSEETSLAHNDRIMLGNEMAFRFVMVTEGPPSAFSRNVVDWECSSKEFHDSMLDTVKESEYQRLEEEVTELRHKCEGLQNELELSRGCAGRAWLVLNDPPSDYTGAFVWYMGWMKDGDSFSFGSSGSVLLPFLSETAVMVRTQDGFVLCINSMRHKLLHSQRITVGGHVFSLSIESAYVSLKSNPGAKLRGARGRGVDSHSELDGQELRQQLYELQWSVALLYDFLFPDNPPEKCPDGTVEEQSYSKKLLLNSRATLEEEGFGPRGVGRVVKSLSETLRIIGSRLAENLQNGNSLCEKQQKLSARMGKSATRKGAERGRSNGHTSRRHSIKPQTGGKPTNDNSPTPPEHSKMSPIPSRRTDGTRKKTLGGIYDRLASLKAKCYIASPSVVQRMNVVMEVLSYSHNCALQLKRYIKEMEILLKKNPNVVAAPVVEKQKLALALVDVLVTLDFNSKRAPLSSEEVVNIEKQMQAWTTIADTCISVLNSRLPHREDVRVSRYFAIRRRQPVHSLQSSSLVSQSNGRSAASLTTPRNNSCVTSAATPRRQLASITLECGTETHRCQVSSGRTPRTLRNSAPFTCRPVTSHIIPASLSMSVHGRAGGSTEPTRLSVSASVNRSLNSPRFPGTSRGVPRSPIHSTPVRPLTSQYSMSEGLTARCANVSEHV